MKASLSLLEAAGFKSHARGWICDNCTLERKGGPLVSDVIEAVESRGFCKGRDSLRAETKQTIRNLSVSLGLSSAGFERLMKTDTLEEFLTS